MNFKSLYFLFTLIIIPVYIFFAPVKDYIVNFNKLTYSLEIPKNNLSKDNYSINKKSKWITNKQSQKITHLFRSMNDCIISTSKSINNDNSLLNCRIKGLEKFNPDLFIIDLKLNLN